MKKAMLWLAGGAAATVGIVAWLTDRADIPAEDRLATIVGTAIVVLFVAAVLAATLRKA